jgi:hypothetical protein
MKILCLSSNDVPTQTCDVTIVKYEPKNYIETFNDYLASKDFDIIGFLGPNDSIIRNYTIEAIKNVYTYIKPHLVYSYLYINNKPRYTLSYGEKRLYEQIVNNPFFTMPSDIRFDKNLKYLHFHDFILKTSKTQTVYRFPYLLFSKIENEDVDVTQDIKYICTHVTQ